MEINQERIYAVLLGGFVGDALGVPVEFLKRATLKKQPVNRMIGFGTHLMPAGSWSDDTSMTLCLMANLQADGNLDDLMQRFVDWYQSGEYTPFGECFDIGIGTTTALQRYLNGIPPLECGGTTVNDNGNGAIMRLSPLVFENLDVQQIGKRIQKITAYTRVTHNHPRAIVGAIIYVELLRAILFGEDCQKGLVHIQQQLQQNLAKQYQSELGHYQRLFQPDFIQLRVAEINSSGYVVDTLEAAIWCVLTNATYRDTVLAAVNLGEDTDTVAMVAGTLAGALYGMAEIPDEWRQTLQNQSLLRRNLVGFSDYYQK